MPKPVKKAVAKKAAPKRPSADPMLRARQLQAEHMERLETSAKPWDSAPAPTATTFKEQLSAHMSALGKKGGKASGAARMTNLSDEQRREIAAKAARRRWELAKLKKKAG
jgi:hypothetical protein